MTWRMSLKVSSSARRINRKEVIVMRSPSEICDNFDDVAYRLKNVENFLNSLDQDEVDEVDKSSIKLLRHKDGELYHKLCDLTELIENFTDEAHEDIDMILDKYFDEIPHDLK
jgi:hypothetical protein